MDMTPACLIFTPIFLPVCTALGMNPIHFGIMMIFNLCIGTITPPVGTTLFVGVKVGKVKIETVFKQLLIYFAAIFVVLMLVTYIPQSSLWLPSLMCHMLRHSKAVHLLQAGVNLIYMRDFLGRSDIKTTEI